MVDTIMSQLYYPLPLNLVSEWPGTRPAGWAPHVGTDFAVPIGTPLRASFDGRIVFVGNDGLGGLTIDLQRADGLIARYGHLDWGRPTRAVGNRVRAGDVIGYSGNSGMSTGPHLHWELRWDRLWTGGRWVDPRTAGAKQFPSSTPAKPKGIQVLRYARAGLSGGRKLKPGQHLYLNTANWQMNQATNVVGGPGEYAIFPHAYLRGKPGDSVILNLMWQNTRATPRRNSNHYQERITFDETGTLDAEGLSVAKRNLAFSRAVTTGYAVYVRVESEKTNRGPVAVDLLTCDALLIK